MRIHQGLVLLGLGCGADSDSGSPIGMDSGSTGPGFDCIEGLNPFLSVQLEVTDIASVPRLRWESDRPITPRFMADIGRTEVLEGSPPAEASMTGELLVLGIPVLRESQVTLLAETEAGLGCSEPIDLDPAPLEVGLPELSLDSDGSSQGYTILSLLTEGEDYQVIIDSQGEYVWTRPAGQGAHSRAVFSETTPSILTMTWAEDEDVDGSIQRISLDGTVLEEVGLQGIHTDFVELPDGNMASIAWEIREFEDADGVTQRVLGDRIVESTDDGSQAVIWSAFDDFSPDLTESLPSGSYPADSAVLDWSHINGLSYDAEEDDYLVSADGLNALVRIDRSTGTRLWTLSDTEGDFSSSDEARLVHGAHSVVSLGTDRLLIFNRNVSYPMDGKDLDSICSEAIEVELDTSSSTAQRSWSYGTEECLLTIFYGEAMRLDNGNTLVIFSSSGQLNEANPAGETVWQLNADVGAAFGFGDRVDSLY